MTRMWQFHPLTRAAILASTAIALAGCENGFELPFRQAASRADSAVTQASPARMVERDVESPEVFYAEQPGLWDGRPSLGGVWVAHAEAEDPERVLIRNTANGQEVVGALFRRERDLPGPAFQVSSDAAAAINMIAGTPTDLEVVALRTREEPEPLDIPAPPPEATATDGGETAPAATALPASIAAAALDAPTPIPDAPAAAPAEAATTDIAAAAIPAPAETPTTLPLETIAAAEAALDAAEIAADTARTSAEAMELASADALPDATAPIAASAPVASPAPAPASGSLERPYVQVAVFTGETNAETAADELRAAGIVPTVRMDDSGNRATWRIVVGPARTSAEREALLETVQGLGYGDAYYVTD
ncbi:SPOR domain-containing protein [Rhodobacterales bacterium HKCCE3408]|nr:SPOR domain-containing protein [Rhodobacterales bacterium HKCCE3408]